VKFAPKTAQIQTDRPRDGLRLGLTLVELLVRRLPILLQPLVEQLPLLRRGEGLNRGGNRNNCSVKPPRAEKTDEEEVGGAGRCGRYLESGVLLVELGVQPLHLLPGEGSRSF